MGARDRRAVQEGETHSAARTSSNNTPESLIVGVGASGALLAGAAIVFITLVGLVSFNVWPSARGESSIENIELQAAAKGASNGAGSPVPEASGQLASSGPSSSGSSGANTGGGGDRAGGASARAASKEGGSEQPPPAATTPVTPPRSTVDTGGGSGGTGRDPSTSKSKGSGGSGSSRGGKSQGRSRGKTTKTVSSPSSSSNAGGWSDKPNNANGRSDK